MKDKELEKLFEEQDRLAVLGELEPIPGTLKRGEEARLEIFKDFGLPADATFEDLQRVVYGRPPKGQKRPKTQLVHVKLDPVSKRHLDELAKQANGNQSEAIRESINTAWQAMVKSQHAA